MLKIPLLAIATLLVLESAALAHGGTFIGPRGEIPPGQMDPRDPQPPPDPGSPTPDPGPGPVPGTPTPRRGGATPPTGPGVNLVRPPRRLRPTSGVDLSHWTFWWTLNRERILDLRGLQTERIRARTKTSSPHFLGGASERGGDDPGKREAWDRMIDVLTKAAEDDNRDVATGAIIALGKARDTRALSTLRTLVDTRSADATVRESAALALGMAGHRSPEVRSFLETVAADSERRTRTRAFAAIGLGYLGDPGALPPLVRLTRVRESTLEVSTAALLGLGLLGDEMVVPDLTRGLAGKRRVADDILRAYHAAAIGAIGSRAGLPALVSALRDKEVEVRRQAVLSIGRLAKPEDADIVKALMHALVHDRDSQTRAFAAVALGEIGAPECADALLHTFRKGESVVVCHAALGLALLVRRLDSEAAKEKIVAFLRGQFAERGSSDMRSVLAVALGIARDQASVKPLLKVLTGKGNPTARAHVAIALGLIGDDAALEPLRGALSEGATTLLQREAALALALLGDRKAVAILLRLVEHGRTEYVRGSAAAALGRLATPETAATLTELLADESNANTTRAFAAVALGMVMDGNDVPILSLVGDHLNHRMATNAVRELLTLL